MIYNEIEISKDLQWEIALAGHSGIDVQTVTNTAITVYFNLHIWKEMAVGDLAWIDTATYHMHRLYSISGISVLALFPANFALRMGATMGYDYTNNPYKFNENIKEAIQANVSCKGADLDPTLYI